MSVIESRKTIVVTLVNTSQREVKMVVPFQPDECFVRAVQYHIPSATTEDDAYYVNSDLVDDTMATFFSDSSSSPQTAFKMHKPVNSLFKFTCFKDDGTSASGAMAGALMLTLEFVKYKAVGQKSTSAAKSG